MPESFVEHDLKYVHKEIVFIVNNITYYAHKDIVIESSKVLKSFHEMLNSDDAISINTNFEVKQEIVELYLNLCYTHDYLKIDRLNFNDFIQLCSFVDRYPTDTLSLDKLEHYFHKFSDEFTKDKDEYRFMDWIKRYQMKTLMKLL